MFAGSKNNAILMSDSPLLSLKNNHSHKHIYQAFTLVMQYKLLKVAFQSLRQQCNALQCVPSRNYTKGKIKILRALSCRLLMLN